MGDLMRGQIQTRIKFLAGDATLPLLIGPQIEISKGHPSILPRAPRSHCTRQRHHASTKGTAAATLSVRPAWPASRAPLEPTKRLRCCPCRVVPAGWALADACVSSVLRPANRSRRPAVPRHKQTPTLWWTVADPSGRKYLARPNSLIFLTFSVSRPSHSTVYCTVRRFANLLFRTLHGRPLFAA